MLPLGPVEALPRGTVPPRPCRLPAIGLAASLTTPAVTAAMMASVEHRQAGIAAGVLNAARRTGALFGVALSGTLIARQGRAAMGDGMQIGFLIAGVLSVCGGDVVARCDAIHTMRTIRIARRHCLTGNATRAATQPPNGRPGASPHNG